MEKDEQTVTIEAIPPTERSGYHLYSVFSEYAHEGLPFSVQALMQIAAFVDANRARLEQEAEEDEARNARAWSADMTDMQRIKDEWHRYRTEGDEGPPTPPTPPSQ